MWSAEAMAVRGGLDDGELCTYPLTRNCSKPSSVVAGNPWKYGPVYVTHIRTRETSDIDGAYRPAAVVALAALDTVPGKVSNTPTGVASFPSTAEAAVATPTTSTVAAPATVPTAPATATVGIRAVARDMPSLTTTVALGTRAAAATTAAPATATTTTTAGGGAVARL